MPYEDQTVKNLILNILSQEQYDELTPEQYQLYLTPDNTVNEIAQAISEHNLSTLSHQDIRNLINAEIQNRITAISNEATSRNNADTGLQNQITTISNTINTYGDIVTHDADEFATAEQGALADTALQPEDNISKLVNDANYITLTDISAENPLNYNNVTGVISVTSGYQIPTTAQTSKIDTALQQADIINNTTSSATNKVLSANAGKILQDQLNNLLGRGKYLSIWDCTTGLAMDTPPVDPYTYENGSYFIVGKVGATNYRPVGSTYSASTPSAVTETEPVKVNDTYYYESTSNTWRLLDTPVTDVAFSTLAGSPYDNTNLSNALNDKADVDDIPTKTSDLTNDSGFITNSALSGYATETYVNNHHDSTKQDTISDLSTIRTNATAGKSANDTIATYGNIVTHNSNEYATASQGAKADSALQQSDIINNVTSSTTNKALSANMGKQLQDQITALTGRGTYLSVWNCTTGLAMTTPTVIPRVYKSGDWFLVGYVGTTNYKPTGTSYDPSVPSTVVETNPIKVNDAYYYDGTTWTLLDTPQVDVAFSTLAGSPYDNTNLANALNDKADVDDIPTKTSDLTNDSDYQNSTQVSSTISTHNTSNTAHDDIRTELAGKQPVGDYATNTALTNGLALKQDIISDLETIREGAELGATALQSVPSEYVTDTELQAYHDSTKQNTTDNNLETTNKTIVGAINEVNSKPSVTSLSALTDVTLTTPADGEVLKYDETTEKWINAQSGGGYYPTILTYQWSDHLKDNMGWLRADTFSWQSGNVYTTAYNHLVSDIAGKTLQSETIGSLTIQYYLADDGHKICPASEENNVITLYTNTNIAWYYILDTTNQRFKLPRNNSVEIHGLLIDSGEQNGVSYRVYQDGYCEQWGRTGSIADKAATTISLSKTFANTNYQVLVTQYEGVEGNYTNGLTVKTFTSNSFILVSRAGGAAYFHWRACGYLATGQYSNAIENNYKSYHKYLYFYVGQFSQTATEQTAGLNAELFNGKVDVDSLVEINPMIISYVSGTSGYNIWANGYCEQWGRVDHGSSAYDWNVTVTFLKKFANTDYQAFTENIQDSGSGQMSYVDTLTTTSMKVYQTSKASAGGKAQYIIWKAGGYLAAGQY